MDTVAYNLAHAVVLGRRFVDRTGRGADPELIGDRQASADSEETVMRWGAAAEFDGAKDYDSCSWHSGLATIPFTAAQRAVRFRRGGMRWRRSGHVTPDNNFKDLVRRFDARRDLGEHLCFTGRRSPTRSPARSVASQSYLPEASRSAVCRQDPALVSSVDPQRRAVSACAVTRKQILKRFRYDLQVCDHRPRVGGDRDGGWHHWAPIVPTAAVAGDPDQDRTSSPTYSGLALGHRALNLDVVLGDERLRVDGGNGAGA